MAGVCPTISIQPGSHVVVVKAAGRKNWQRDLEVLKDSQVALRPVLGPQASAQAQPSWLRDEAQIQKSRQDAGAKEVEDRPLWRIGLARLLQQ